MLNKRPLLPALSLAGVSLAWATTVSAGNSPAAADGGSLAVLAIGGVVLLLVFVLLVWRILAHLRAKKSDPAALMTLEQISRLETPGDDSPFVRTVQPRAIPSPMSEKAVGGYREPSESDKYLSDLEKYYPRIVEKLVMLWPDPEAENYLQGLSFDERGDREGFSREVAAEIMLLYGVKLKEHKDVWH